ncbi:MAG: YtxH domain-containing protein [Clostridia bacterium]|nr:YtxH domain-containing protein [Clostridia bacterium]
MFMQKKNQCPSSGKYIVGIISGVVAGATIGSVLSLMFAPCSGKETRRFLKKKTENITDTVKSTFQDMKDGMCD